MVADGELGLVDEMIAARVCAVFFLVFDKVMANHTLGGNHLKRSQNQDNGTTSNGALTLGRPR